MMALQEEFGREEVGKTVEVKLQAQTPSVEQPDVRLKELAGGGGGGRKRTMLLVLENQVPMMTVFARTLASEDREVHFARDEAEAAIHQCVYDTDIFIWVGWGVPPIEGRDVIPFPELKAEDSPKGRSVASVVKSTTPPDDYELVNKKPYIIAVTSESDYFTPEECRKLGIREQIAGPPDHIKTGKFKERLIKAIAIAEREIQGGAQNKN